MTEAMPLEDFERMRKGLPPVKVKKVNRPEPEKPDIKNEIKFKDIPIDWFKSLDSAKRNTLKNKEGMRFIGYDVEISLGKNKAGAITNEEKNIPKSMSGWMDEGNFMELVRTVRKQINPQVINW